MHIDINLLLRSFVIYSDNYCCGFRYERKKLLVNKKIMKKTRFSPSILKICGSKMPIFPDSER